MFAQIPNVSLLLFTASFARVRALPTAAALMPAPHGSRHGAHRGGPHASANTSHTYLVAPIKLHGGLNNMLMNIAQLLHDSCTQENAVLVLPALNSGFGFFRRNYQAGNVQADLRFGDLFDVHSFIAGVQPCRVVDKPPAGAPTVEAKVQKIQLDGPWNYSRTLAMVYRALKPSASLNATLTGLLAKAARDAGPRWASVHLRIERDWWWQSGFCDRPGLRRCYSPDEVAAITSRSRTELGATGVLLMYAPDNLSPCGPAVAFEAFSANRTWNMAHEPTWSYTLRAAVELFLAAAAPAGFYGNSYSSFSRGVALLRHTQCVAATHAPEPSSQRCKSQTFSYDCGPRAASMTMDILGRAFDVVNNGGSCHQPSRPGRSCLQVMKYRRAALQAEQIAERREGFGRARKMDFVRYGAQRIIHSERLMPPNGSAILDSVRPLFRHLLLYGAERTPRRADVRKCAMLRNCSQHNACWGAHWMRLGGSKRKWRDVHTMLPSCQGSMMTGCCNASNLEANHPRCRRAGCDFLAFAASTNYERDGSRWRCRWAGPQSGPWSRDCQRIYSHCLPVLAAAAWFCAQPVASRTRSTAAPAPATSREALERLSLLGLAWSALSPLQGTPALLWGLRLPSVASDFVDAFGRFVDRHGQSQATTWALMAPVAKPLACPPALRPPRAGGVELNRLEPIYPTQRNLFGVELSTCNSFLPYRILPSLPGFDLRSHLRQRRVLVDVGTSGFHASAKFLIDLYATTMPFTHVHRFEPDDGVNPSLSYIQRMLMNTGLLPGAVDTATSMAVPVAYQELLNFTRHRAPVEVGSRRPAVDLVAWLHESVTLSDFVVLKFDIDEEALSHAHGGPTMEWGFLADLVHSEEIAKVDEMFIQMRFPFDHHVERDATIGWRSNNTHSMWQAYDLLRELRRCGLPIHAWS